MTITRPTWDEFFLGLAKYYSTRSKDPSTKVGAVIVRPDRTVAGLGFNGFPRGMPDSEKNLSDRTRKYPRMIHAEINAKDSCNDPSLRDYVCYGTFMPCDRCFMQLVGVGIRKFVFPKPTPDELTRWGSAFDAVREMAQEMNTQEQYEYFMATGDHVVNRPDFIQLIEI